VDLITRVARITRILQSFGTVTATGNRNPLVASCSISPPAAATLMVEFSCFSYSLRASLQAAPAARSPGGDVF